MACHCCWFKIHYPERGRKLSNHCLGFAVAGSSSKSITPKGDGNVLGTVLALANNNCSKSITPKGDGNN